MNERNAVEVEHLSKKFGDKFAVNDISFDVHRGEVFGLLGPNGAGKTTTLRMMTTLLKQTAGQVTIFGFDTLKQGKAARSTFGLTGQYATVDEDISARENLMIFGRLNGLTRPEAKQRATELLAEFSLTKSADKAISEFSGGMRRRLDLAISLITRPELIFLDEPTTGLDPRTRNQMWDTIRQLVKQGSTIVLTTQYLEEADELADRVAVIDHGELIKLGTPQELKSQIGSSTLEISTCDAQQTTTAANLIGSILHESPNVTDSVISTKLADPNQVSTVLDELHQHAIQLNSLSVKEPTLDDVFFALTVGTN